MAIEIKNHADGTTAGVTTGHQLLTRAEAHTLAHHQSAHHQDAYKVISIDTGITAQDQTVFHIINTSSTKDCVIQSVRVADISTITTYVIGNYFELGFGRTATSGTTATPVNLNLSSGKTAGVTVRGIAPSMTGAFTAFERIYTILGDDVLMVEDGSIILGLNDTMEVRFVSTGTGEARVAVTFMMITP